MMKMVLTLFVKFVECFLGGPSKKETVKPNVEPELKNDSNRLRTEWSNLHSKNIQLKLLIYDVDGYVWKKYKKNIVITMIYRTQEQQDDIYKDNEKYQNDPFRSPHQFWHAVDLRSRIFTEKEIKNIVKYINKKYNKGNYYKWTTKDHNVGRGDHFHIQYYGT